MNQSFSLHQGISNYIPKDAGSTWFLHKSFFTSRRKAVPVRQYTKKLTELLKYTKNIEKMYRLSLAIALLLDN